MSMLAKIRKNSTNIFLAIISSLLVWNQERCHYFDLLPTPLICEHFVMMTCNTILCTLQSNDKFAGIHSSLHNCVKTDPNFWLMNEVSWNKTEIFPKTKVIFTWMTEDTAHDSHLHKIKVAMNAQNRKLKSGTAVNVWLTQRDKLPEAELWGSQQ